MRLHIDIDSNIQESSITIQASEIDDKLKSIIEFIEQTTKPKQINGRRDKDIHLINLDKVYRFYIEDKILTMETKEGKYIVDQRLYQIEKIITKSFIKISKSEIVNLDYVDHLSFTNTGHVQIFIKNGVFTYSSRRYLKDIKERLNL
ncbi:LytTR family transcriptional regulator [Salicibibacter cibarius]|uniref:LytTR family transcriptional regulator n=1 Tax=Salicibibacter cibarius TaxID=2743000 RepID=A0A7T6Z1X5_9BACI|nr:LytTR family DNA-binding domain-containing protein [Salicibibacter cibarius]QQK75451.1 LytTR family transcriptional regulator [Salicibibacter cibarius]